MSSASHQGYDVTNAVSAPPPLLLQSLNITTACLPNRVHALKETATLVSLQVVVGGSSGIGFSICEEFLSSGARVLSLSRSATTADGAQHVHCDLSSHASIMAAAAAVSSVYGGKPTPITLVLNAGHGKCDSAHSVTHESLMQHLNINVVSQVWSH
jgi:NADP-dependent 3-hydroxy acid dehydrogenase YdfG